MAQRRGYAVFGLIGLLLVVAIIFALNFAPGGVAEKSLEARQEAEGLAATLDARQIAMLAAIHRQAEGSLPQTRGEFDTDPRIFEDRRGNPVEIAYETTGRSSTVLVLTSAGPDGVAGNEDDVDIRAPLPY